MVAYVLYVGAALYLGILTSISPCPLATNVAAISFIARRLARLANGFQQLLLERLGRVIRVGAVVPLRVEEHRRRLDVVEPAPRHQVSGEAAQPVAAGVVLARDRREASVAMPRGRRQQRATATAAGAQRRRDALTGEGPHQTSRIAYHQHPLGIGREEPDGILSPSRPGGSCWPARPPRRSGKPPPPKVQQGNGRQGPSSSLAG